MFDGLIAEFEPGIALDQPSAKALSYVLRHQELWPEGFKWNYRDCSCCAIGLTERLWRRCYGGKLYDNIVSDLGLSSSSVRRIFLHLHLVHCTVRIRITPEHVADAIDKEIMSHV